MVPGKKIWIWMGISGYLAGLDCAFVIYFANFNWQQKCYWICQQGWILYCICCFLNGSINFHMLEKG